jgi:predicted PurR-regulated permease PerM
MLRDGALARVRSTIEDITSEIKREEERQEAKDDARDRRRGDPPSRPESEEEPTPVEIAQEDGLLNGTETAVVTPALGLVANAGAVVVLVIFMLLRREDLRNRVVSLGGHTSLALTTKALDEAAKRISRFLLAQFLLNASMGLAVALGLFVIGVPYAALWGLSAALLRYIPYVGPCVAAALPILVSLMTSSGWTQVALVAALFIVLELISNNVMEPLLYGHSVGLSAMAVIVAALFWTWLWGPLGLVLATPLTVCLAVLGKYVPALQFFDRLLSQEPALAPHVWLYHRLLARDRTEADQILAERLKKKTREETCDELLLPALQLAREDIVDDRISDDDERYVENALRDMITRLHEGEDEAEVAAAGKGVSEAQRLDPAAHEGATVAGFPFRHAGDELVLAMLASLFREEKDRFKVLSADLLMSEKIAALKESQPACICLAVLKPAQLTHVRQLCKRLRSSFPDATLFVGCFGFRGDMEKIRRLLRGGGADWVFHSLSELKQRVEPLLVFHARAEKEEEQNGEKSEVGGQKSEVGSQTAEAVKSVKCNV